MNGRIGRAKETGRSFRSFVLPFLAVLVFVTMPSCNSHEAPDPFGEGCKAIADDSVSGLKKVVEAFPPVVTARDGFDGSTLLHRVSAGAGAPENRIELAKVLVERGADANAKDRTGATPLDLALRFSAPPQYVEWLETAATAQREAGDPSPVPAGKD